MPRLYLFDTLFHIFRAFYAVPRHLKAPDGTPNNAVHGVLGIFANLWRTQKVEYAAAVFESFDGIFREEIDPQYKANREAPDPRLLQQIPLVEEACQRLGIPSLNIERYEADDVIGTLTKQACAAGVAVTIVSNDKDLAQLLCLGPEVELIRTAKKGKLEIVRPPNVEELFGVPAELIPSWLALRGDAVDNIPGLAGVGPKTASKLLLEHGDLSALLECPEQAGPRWGPKLAEARERLRTNLRLTTIETEVPLENPEFSLESFRPRSVEGASDFFERLGMRRHRREVEQLEPGLSVSALWT